MIHKLKHSKYFLSIKVLKYVIFKLFAFYPSKNALIITNHLFGTSFKFSKKETNNRFIVLKYFIKMFYQIDHITSPIQIFNDIIFDCSDESKNIRISFMKFYSKKVQFDWLSYSSLLFFNSWFKKLIYLIYNVPFVFLYFILSQLFTNRSSFALLIEYPIVLSNFNSILIQNKFQKEIYYFSIYQRESNFLSYYLRQPRQFHFL